jgi:hypothetical protein
VIADSVFDAGAFRDHLAGRAFAAVIATNPTQASRPALDRYALRQDRTRLLLHDLHRVHDALA